MSAAQVGGNVTGDLDATGCDVGVYYDAGATGDVSGASIHGAKQFGVFVDGDAGDVTVDVTNSEIYQIGDNPFTGSQHGVGIYYYGFGTAGSVDGAVYGNNVHDYQKGGIVVNGENASADVAFNTVTGLDEVPFIAQNGIQFGYGAGGSVHRNTVDGQWYSGANWTSSGILLFETSGVSVVQNVVTSSQSGIVVESWCWFVKSADGNTIKNNDVEAAEYGITVDAVAWDGYSTCGATADNNKVVSNTLRGDGSADSTGVFVGAYDESTAYDPAADGNKVVANDIAGFAYGIDDEGAGTHVHANVVP